VLVPDLEQTAAVTWPGYASAALSHGVHAVFAFPMQDGATRLGALDVYRERPGALSDWAVARALGFAEVAMDTILDSGGVGADASEVLVGQHDVGFEVYQAQGMVMVQLDITLNAALARMRATAYSRGVDLGQLSADIVAGRAQLTDDEGGLS
jgi:hypothetical protein